MKFVPIEEMSRTIRENFHKVPHDIDFVIGIPRSGILCGSIIAEYLNVPLIDVDSFYFGASPTGGARLRFHKPSGRTKERALVVDDTIFHGRSMARSKEKLAPLSGEYEFIYMAVFLEGPCSNVDLWLADLRPYTENYKEVVLYEWNIFHHTTRFVERCIYDIDGVLCLDPHDDRNREEYEAYIANATPLFTLSNRVGEIVSYRISAYKDITAHWLKATGIEYGALTLFPARSRDERSQSGISPADFKADIYRKRTWAVLFVESDDWQAKRIFELAGKPVYCVKSNKLYA